MMLLLLAHRKFTIVVTISTNGSKYILFFGRNREHAKSKATNFSKRKNDFYVFDFIDVMLNACKIIEFLVTIAAK